MRGEKPARAWLRPYTLIACALGLSLALLFLSLVDPRGLRRLRLLREDAEKAELANAALRLENARLSRTAQRLGPQPSLEALEKAAREQLGFVRQDEVLFKLE